MSIRLGNQIIASTNSDINLDEKDILVDDITIVKDENEIITATGIKSVNGNYVFERIFAGCTNIKSIEFPKLAKIEAYYGMNYAFEGCNSLQAINFDALETISGDYCFEYAFRYCSGLESISFPSLTIINSNNSFNYMFKDCSSLKEIHFRADMETRVKSLEQYNTIWGLGAGKAQIVFDL